MDLKTKTVGKVELGASSGAEGWKDFLQLLKEQNEKIERFARALSIIQQGLLRNNPLPVTDSVNEATEVLGGMLNTRKCLLESRVQIQKRMESHTAKKKMGIFRRPLSASLGDIPKNQAKGENRAAPSPPQEKTLKGWKGGPSPSYAQVAKGQAPTKKGTVAKPKLKRSTPARSGDAITVSAKDGQFYANILREMMAKGDPRRAGLEVLSVRRTRKKNVFLILKKGGDVSAFREELDRVVGERGNFGPDLDEVPRN